MSGRRQHRSLIIECPDNPPSLQDQLTDLGYTNCERVENLDDALDAIVRQDVRLLVIDHLGNEELESVLEFIQRVRARSAEYVYIVLLNPAPDAGTLMDAFVAGVDDMIRTPVDPVRLAGRLNAAERILEYDAKHRERVVELEKALKRLEVSAAKHAPKSEVKRDAFVKTDGVSPSETLKTMAAYTEVDQTFLNALVGFLGMPFGKAPISPMLEAPAGVRISLTEASKGLDFTVGLMFPQTALVDLAQEILGDGSLAENREALLLEAANVVMGAVKASFFAHELTFTGGLPILTQATELEDGFSQHPVRTRSRIAVEGGVEIELVCYVKETSNRRILATDAREGMVVIDDVKDESGALVVQAGTRLTESLAVRLARMAPLAAISVSMPSAMR